ncbi:MAG: isochorismatase family protein [Alphaproteobacteria bacterium]|jgi:nicotinamidase-related amidase|nr:isochorismatase family protein [Alphaproteobacteria bacterium]
MADDIQEALDRVFGANSELYQNRGFQRRIGWGERPALLVIDMARAWTRPDNAFSCAEMETIIPAHQALLDAFRAKGLPIVYTTTAYEVTEGAITDAGLWQYKIPAETLKVGSEAVGIDDRIAPLAGEIVITKKRASAFHGTPLAGMLQAAGVDTVVITGVTASACVRNSVEDAIADGFRPIVVREAVGDRIAGAVAWNLFDIDAKFGDVEPLEAVLDHLRRNDY